MLWPKSRITAPKCFAGDVVKGSNLIAAAIAGLLVAALWPAFDESGRGCYGKRTPGANPSRLPDRSRESEVFDEVVGVRAFG